MNDHALILGLRIAGLMMVGLVIANFVAAKRFRYAANLEASDTIVRQIFYVHCSYIVLIIAALALLCLWSGLVWSVWACAVRCQSFKRAQVQ